MSSPITIVVTAETAQAAQQLAALAQQTGSGLNVVKQQVAQMGQEAAKAGEHVAGMSYYFRSGIDSIRFALAGGGERALFYSLDELTRGLVASGLAMSQLIPILGTLGLAAGAGYLVWEQYAQHQQAVIEQTIELQHALEKLPETLKNIQDAASTGLIGEGAADTLAGILTGQKKYTVTMPAGQALMQGRISQEQYDAARGAAETPATGPLQNPFVQDVEMGGAMVNVEANLAERTKLVNDQLVKRGYLMDELDQKGKATGKYIATPAGQALLEEMKMQKELQLDALTGIDRERAAAKQKFDEDMEHLTTLKREAETNGPGGQTEAQRKLLAGLPALSADIQAAYQNKLDEINQKQAADKVTISPEQIRQQGAQDFLDKNKQIEDEITAKVQSSGKEREAFYQEEYKARVTLATQALYSGQITEEQYSDAVSKAAEQMLESQRKVNEALKREQALRQEIARAQTEGNLKAVEGNPFLTDDQKRQQSIPLYQQLMGQNWQAIGSLAQTAGNSQDQGAQLEARKQMYDLMQQQYEMQQKINEAAGADSWNYQLQGMVTHFTNLKSLAQQTTEIFSGGLDTAMNSVASNMTKVVLGMEKGRKAVLSIEEAILGNLISAIIKAGEQWVVSEVMKYTLGQVLQQTAVATSAATAAEESAVWWTPAVLSTIASAGTTAADAAALVGGAILGFAEGGRPEPGKVALIGEQGPELWVPDEAGTVIPSDRTAAMMQGRGGAGGYAPGSSSAAVNLHFYDERPHPRDYMNSSEGENHVVSIARKNRMKIGVGT